MEQRTPHGMTPPFPYGGVIPNDTSPANTSADSVLTDRVLDELKRQSVNGCLLCSLDAWDAEEWD